jgi:tetratricopeptide (TPR) repeat protein
MEAKLHQMSGRHEKAVERAIDSLALVYLQPWLHCLLGTSLREIGEYARAEQSFRVALAQMPGLALAHYQLGRLLRREPARLGEASLHLATAKVLRDRRKAKRPAATEAAEASPEAASPEATGAPAGAMPGFDSAVSPPPADRSRVVTVVSGLPRSGTSMMMQMLTAGGIQAFSDGRRPADDDNPRGYFEHEKATQLHRDAKWVAEARGQVVKIVAHLLPYLPAGEEYRIVFMHRPLEEVTASQGAMLHRLGRKGGNLERAQLARVYAGQLVRVQEWLKQTAGVHVLSVQYAQVLEDPAGAAERLAGFLGDPFDSISGAAAVAPELRRQRDK